MRDLLHTLSASDLQIPLSNGPKHPIHCLESGQVIYIPQFSFELETQEQVLLNPVVCDTKKKNISYDYQSQKLGGVSKHNPYQNHLQSMMHRYALFAKTLVDSLLPDYQSALRWGRTSYRPTEIIGRQRSKRQDDTRIHVDAFPATPVQGWRILRVFCNINPDNKPRVWHVGEPFASVLNKFAAQLPTYSPLKAKLLHHVKATKSLRTAYDHYMLHLHDQMKLDDDYQATFEKTRIDFAANSTWIVFTDHVSHAALGGQYLLEQTFYVPVSAMVHPEQSPLKQMEQRHLLTS
ncbi:MAG: hypothetical protein CK424_07020 [Legionella sp.]|nr:MAG: hypothetical protein CK424_07020 [Legionella sp.]